MASSSVVAKAREAGAGVPERWTEHLGFGVAYRTDIHALHAHWASRIEDLRLNTRVDALLLDGDRGGAPPRAARRSGRARCCSPAEVSKVTRSWSSASSAGTPTGSSLRSNTGSVGDGFRLAQSAGAAASSGLGTFYGHTVASPLIGLRAHELPAARPVPLEVVRAREPARPPLHRTRRWATRWPTS